MPSHELRATRGPQPPDAAIRGLQSLLREELVDVPVGTTPDELRALLSKRFVPELRSAAHQITRRTRAEVGRVLSPERAERIPTQLPAESRQHAEYVERVLEAVVAAVAKALGAREDAEGDGG